MLTLFSNYNLTQIYQPKMYVLPLNYKLKFGNMEIFNSSRTTSLIEQ